jgi:hypothetical protein
MSSGFGDKVIDTASAAFLVTVSDTVADPNGPFNALYCGAAAGDIKLTTLEGQDIVLTAPPLGILKIGCSRVWSNGTTKTSTLIVGLR